jgi:hypothetical protein
MKSVAPQLDVTPGLAKQVIDLYTNELPDVRFPDLDLADLLQLQAELHVAQLELEDVEATLAEARQAVEARSHVLIARAERALSYARVFAQGNPVLSPRVAEIGRKKGAAAAGLQLAASTASGGDDAAVPIKRGRKPKLDAPSELFNQPACAD